MIPKSIARVFRLPLSVLVVSTALMGFASCQSSSSANESNPTQVTAVVGRTCRTWSRSIRQPAPVVCIRAGS